MLALYRHFITVVDRGGFTAAAQELGVTQPTLTRSLQTLEFRLGVRLLERSGGTIAPTAEGLLILRRARFLLAENRSLLEDLRQMSLGRCPVTCVNGPPMTAMWLIPNLLRRMAQAHPEFPVSVRGDVGADYDWKLKAILSGELDVALTLYDPMIQRENLRQELLFEPEVRIVVGRSHPVANDPDISLERLRTLPWIVPPSGSGSRTILENGFAQQGLDSPRHSIEISDWGIAFDMLEAGMFVMAIPFHPACFDDELSRFRVLPVQFTVRSPAVSMVTRPMSAGRPGTRAVVEMVRRIVRGSGDEAVSGTCGPSLSKEGWH
jgi:DNA-binding transcriptional LysR family regulator